MRTTASWQWVLVTAVVASAIGAWIFSVVATELLDLRVQQFVQFLERLATEEGIEITEEEARHRLVGFLAMGQAWVMLGLLALARWWQSLLYNPGGFRAEFHRLRLPPTLGAAIVLLMIGCAWTDEPEFDRWLAVLTVPLAMAGLGLVHWAIGYNKLSKGWVGAFYTGLVLLLQLVYPMLVAAALMDSWFDIRKRFETDREV